MVSIPMSPLGDIGTQRRVPLYTTDTVSGGLRQALLRGHLNKANLFINIHHGILNRDHGHVLFSYLLRVAFISVYILII